MTPIATDSNRCLLEVKLGRIWSNTVLTTDGLTASNRTSALSATDWLSKVTFDPNSCHRSMSNSTGSVISINILTYGYRIILLNSRGSCTTHLKSFDALLILRSAAGCDVFTFDKTCMCVCVCVCKKMLRHIYIHLRGWVRKIEYNNRKNGQSPKLTGRQETFGQRLCHFAGTEKSDFQHIRGISVVYPVSVNGYLTSIQRYSTTKRELRPERVTTTTNKTPVVPI